MLQLLAKKTMDITQAQWQILEPLMPRTVEGKVGRPSQDIRQVLNGILWTCRTGAPWHDMPGKYPSYQTCHRYFQKWVDSGLWNKILWRIAQDLKDRGKIDLTECFIDGTFAAAKKGALVLEKLKEVKGQRSWRSQTLLVFLSPYGPDQQTPMSANLWRKLLM